MNAIVAETDKEAKQLATTQTLFFLNIVTNAQQNLQPPMASEEDVWKTQMHAQKKPHFGPVDFEGNPDLQPRACSSGTNDCLFAYR